MQKGIHNSFRLENTRKFKYEDFLYLVLLLLIQIFFIKVTFLKILPLVSGWFLQWGKLSLQSNVYSDFFFPFPPLGLFVLGILPWQFEDQLLAEQVISAIIWVLISAVTYLLLRKFFSSFTSFVAATLSLTAYLAYPTNITSGFLELAWLFALVSVYLLLVAKNTSHIFLFLSGATMAMSVLVKQTYLLPAFLVAISIMLYKQDNYYQFSKQFKSLLIWGGGFAASIIVCCIFLSGQGSLIIAFEQIFSGGGKNPGGSPILMWGLGQLNPSEAAWPIFILIIMGLIFQNNAGIGANIKVAILLIFGFSTAAMFGFYAFSTGSASNLLSQFIVIAPLIASLIGIIIQIRFTVRRSTPLMTIFGILIYSFTFLLSLLVLAKIQLMSLESDYELLAGMGHRFNNYLVYSGVISLFLLLFAKLNNRNTEFSWNNSSNSFFVIFCLSFGVAAANLLSGGGGIPTYFLALGFGIGLLIRFLEQSLNIQALKAAVTITLIPALVLLNSIQILTPYDWFGLQESPLYSTRSFSEVPSLQSFELSEQTAEDYDFIYNSLKTIYPGENFDNLNKEILFGSNISGLSESVFELEPYPLVCPVIWWDVCLEQNSSIDLVTIKKNPPKVIVWNFAPEWVIAGHESAFRNGKASAIRNLENWITDQYEQGCYKLIGQRKIGVGATTSDPWVTKIYEYTCTDIT